MDGPDLGIREEIAAQAIRATERDDEEELERVLQGIEEAMRVDLDERPPRGDLSGPEAWSELAAIESWAAVASNATARFYGPASPFRRDIEGWSKTAVAKLRSIANSLKPALEKLLGALHAIGFTIGVAFPWGISIGLTF